MPIHDFWLFALASLALNITPGNDMLFVISRSTARGIKAGVISALGIMGGCMVHIVAAVAGLSAIISTSAFLFELIKYAGAAYLIYLGLRSILSRKKSLELTDEKRESSYSNLFWQGVITNVMNPKVALFFLAFLPQFIHTGSATATSQILWLGTWFNFSGTVVNIIVAILFGTMGNWLSRSPRFLRWQERVTGLILVGLGIKVALSSRN